MKNINKKLASQNGVSILTLVVTIVVIILISAIVLFGNDSAIDNATIATFQQELKEVEVGVSSVRISNQKDGMGEEYKEQGFYPVMLENPPKNFVSFGDADYYGYVVDLNNIKNTETKHGHEYAKYKNTNSGDTTISFGTRGKNNDVYIYDATGKVFYAKGFYVKDGVYFSDILSKEGPIISIDKTYNKSSNNVELSIIVEPVEDNSNIIVRVNNSTPIAKEGENHYRYTVINNGSYVISVEELADRVSTKRVKVSEITEKECTIRYHFQDGSTPNEEVVKKPGEQIKLKAIRRAGYTLMGWAKTSSAVEADYLPGSLFAENIDTDLYAVWKVGNPKEYTITFNANGGLNAPESIIKTDGIVATLPLDEPTYGKYVFKGWSESSTATVPKYSSGDRYEKEGNQVLFAVWEKGETRIDIEVNPVGAGIASGDGKKEVGSVCYVKTAPNPGYIFDKWIVVTPDIKLENNYSETTRFTMPKGTVKLIANFKKTSYDYKIKYDANSGAGAPATQNKKHDESINISSSIPTRSSYEFLGWTDIYGSNTVKYLPGDMYTANESVTLFAVWEKIN